MDTIPSTETADPRRWIALAGLVAIPVYLVPVGIWGSRALWPRAVRQATTGALFLGVLSLLSLSLRPLARKKAVPSKDERWKLPIHHAVMPEEFAASAASGR